MIKQPAELAILFEPIKHEYTVNGRKADISVTALIDKQVTKVAWHNIDATILNAAADRGTNVHADLENIVKLHTEPTTQEGRNYLEFLNTGCLENPKTEFKLALYYKNLLLTGTADLIAMYNNRSAMIDYKTTSQIHEESVRWQLSLLDYMARACDGCIINGELFTYTPAETFYIFHFDKQAKFTTHSFNKISDLEIERLLDAESDKQEYTPIVFLTPRIQQEIINIQTEIVKLKQAQAYLEEQDKALKAGLLQAFQAHPDVKKLDCPEFSVSYVAPTSTVSFNEKAFLSANPSIVEEFKQAHPEVDMDEYNTTSNRVGYVRITLNKNSSPITEEVLSNMVLPKLPIAPQKKPRAKNGYFS